VGLLTGERGLTSETVERYKLGFLARRITFPVRVRGKLYNVRRSKPHAYENRAYDPKRFYRYSFKPEAKALGMPTLKFH
jgi:hypothetical protein